MESAPLGTEQQRRLNKEACHANGMPHHPVVQSRRITAACASHSNVVEMICLDAADQQVRKNRVHGPICRS